MPYKSGTIGTISAFFCSKFLHKYINQQNLNFQNEVLSSAEHAMPQGTPNMVKARD